MIKSDCEEQQGDYEMEKTERRTAAAGTKEWEGWAESQASEQTRAQTKVPSGCDCRVFDQHSRIVEGGTRGSGSQGSKSQDTN